MSIAATGSLGIAVERLRALIAGSAAWTAWVNGQASPASRLFLVACPASTPRPYGILALGNDAAWRRTAVTLDGFDASGTIILGIDADVNPAHDDADAETDVWNRLEALLQEIATAANQGGQGLVIDGIDITAGPERTQAEQRKKFGDRYQIEVAFSIRVLAP